MTAFHMTVGAMGRATKLVIDGRDVSHVARAATLNVEVGRVPTLTVDYLCLHPNSTIEGEADVIHRCLFAGGIEPPDAIVDDLLLHLESWMPADPGQWLGREALVGEVLRWLGLVDTPTPHTPPDNTHPGAPPPDTPPDDSAGSTDVRGAD